MANPLFEKIYHFLSSWVSEGLERAQRTDSSLSHTVQKKLYPQLKTRK